MCWICYETRLKFVYKAITFLDFVEYCLRTWDSILCWPDTPAGTVAVQKCPNWVNKFNTRGNWTLVMWHTFRSCLQKYLHGETVHLWEQTNTNYIVMTWPICLSIFELKWKMTPSLNGNQPPGLPTCRPNDGLLVAVPGVKLLETLPPPKAQDNVFNLNVHPF